MFCRPSDMWSMSSSLYASAASRTGKRSGASANRLDSHSQQPRICTPGAAAAQALQRALLGRHGQCLFLNH